jgi:chromosome segregation ATPase
MSADDATKEQIEKHMDDILSGSEDMSDSLIVNAAESSASRARMRYLGDQLQSASAEAGAYSAVLGDMRDQVQELQRSSELRFHLADRIQELEALLEAREIALTEANGTVLEVETAYRDLQIQASGLRQQVEDGNLKLDSARDRIAFLERTLERLDQDYESQREANAGLRSESMAARMEASAISVRMESLQRRHDELRAEHSRQQVELDTGRREFERQVGTLRSLYEAVQIKLATLESVRNHLAGQADTLRRENMRLKQMVEGQQKSGEQEAEKWRLYAQSLERIMADNGLNVRVQPVDELDANLSQISRLPIKPRA